jgi:hypothetical protein
MSSGLAAAVRTAREVNLSEPLDVIRTDLSGGIDVGRELVGDAAETLAETVARLQGRSRRRSWRRPAMVGLTIGIIAVLAFAAWWLRRRAADVAVQDDRLDREPLDRAADEGMGTAIGSPTPEPSEPERVLVAMEIVSADASGVRSD